MLGVYYGDERILEPLTKVSKSTRIREVISLLLPVKSISLSKFVEKL